MSSVLLSMHIKKLYLYALFFSMLTISVLHAQENARNTTENQIPEKQLIEQKAQNDTQNISTTPTATQSLQIQTALPPLYSATHTIQSSDYTHIYTTKTNAIGHELLQKTIAQYKERTKHRLGFSILFSPLMQIQNTVIDPNNPKREINGIAGNTIIFMGGLGLGIYFSPRIFLLLELQISYTRYLYLDTYKTAMLTPETSSTILGDIADTLGIYFSTPINIGFTINSIMQFTIGLGPGFYFRIPIFAIDNSKNIAKITTYFIQNLRFLYIESQVGMRFLLSKKIHFAAKITSKWPLSVKKNNIITSPVHHMLIGASFGLHILL